MAGCVFCGATPTTKEHVFPRWLLEVIPGEGPITHTWTAPEGSSALSRTWTKDVIDFKAKVVCQQRCNGGWMSQLERRARPVLAPMIRGRRSTLYPDAAETIAYWTLKTALMVNLAQEPDFSCAPKTSYAQLYSTKGVLPNTFVWLGACDFGAGAHARPRVTEPIDGDPNHLGFACTLAVGHLVIEIIRIPVENGKTLQIGGQLAPALRRLWPYTNVIVWPPPVLLSRENTASLAHLIAASPISLLAMPHREYIP